MLQVVADHPQEVEVYRRWWGERRVDGVILVDLRVRRPPHRGECESLSLPAVVIGHPVGRPGRCIPVWSDDAGPSGRRWSTWSRSATGRIARVAGLPGWCTPRCATAPSPRSAPDVGPGARRSIVHTDYTGEEGARATRRLLSSARRPTAIIYDNDIMAVAGLSVAQEMGLAVPGDLSIVAWDDSPLSPVVHPPLTALSRDIPAYGAHAARRLLALVAGENPGPYEDEAAHLTPRGSTAPPPRRDDTPSPYGK